MATEPGQGVILPPSRLLSMSRPRPNCCARYGLSRLMLTPLVGGLGYLGCEAALPLLHDYLKRRDFAQYGLVAIADINLVRLDHALVARLCVPQLRWLGLGTCGLVCRVFQFRFWA